jgi:predicted transglutaminase-like cysteine proteinase
MQRAIIVRAWRAIWFVGGLSLICPSTELMAGTTTSSVSRTDEPFGLSTSMVITGTLLNKWLKIEREVDDERLLLKICEDDRASCRSPTALQYLAIIDSARPLVGRAQLGEINRAINLKIRPMSDLAHYGEEDVWSPPLATLAEGAGDCEDFAIAKFVALQEVGSSY